MAYVGEGLASVICKVTSTAVARCAHEPRARLLIASGTNKGRLGAKSGSAQSLPAQLVQAVPRGGSKARYANDLARGLGRRGDFHDTHFDRSNGAGIPGDRACASGGRGPGIADRRNLEIRE